MSIHSKLSSLFLAFPLLISGCSTQDDSSSVSADQSAATTSQDSLNLDDATLQPSAANSPCSKELSKYPQAAKACQQIDALKKKYAGRDIVVATIGALSNGAIGAYVVYDYSDLQAAKTSKQIPAPLEKKANATETVAWGSYGVAGVAIYATDAGSPAVEGYAYGTAGYGPNGGVIILKSSTPKNGKRSTIIPLVW